MKQYRKRPLVIEAAQWDGFMIGDHYPGMLTRHGVKWRIGKLSDDGELFEIIIETLEGDMICEIGDWIIKGVKGEFYPIKNEIFLESYEPVTEMAIEETRQKEECEPAKLVFNYPTKTEIYDLNETSCVYFNVKDVDWVKIYKIGDETRICFDIPEHLKYLVNKGE